MDHNEKINRLCACLREEINWVETLNQVLIEERKALETRKFSLLDEFAQQKHDLSKKLEQSAQERMILINKDDKGLELCLREFLFGHSESDVQQVNSLNTQLSALLNQCRELNSVNGQVIANNLYIRKEMVNTLSGNAGNAMDIYDAHGSITTSRNQDHYREV